MKRNIIRISALAIILCMMAVSFIPNTVFAAGTGKAIQLVDSNNPTGGISDQDHVYFGTETDNYTWTDETVYWRVLDADATNKGESGMFLLHENLIGNNPGGSYGNIKFNSDSTKGNGWQGSDAQSWCSTFLSNTFSSLEQAAIMATTKDDAAYTYEDKEYSYTVDFKASENILNGDKIFFLSAQEADSEAYGFTDNASRKKSYNNGSGYWWLRSPYAHSGNSAGIVYGSGMDDDLVDHVNAARPAFNLNLSSVIFTSAAEGGKSSGTAGADALKEISDYSGNDWKLTLKDDNREFTASLDSQDGDVLTIKYSNAKSGDNEYISAIIVNSTGEITYYGNLGAVSTESGTVTVNLSGKYSKDNGDKLYVFNEQCNGDKKTDYSSTLIDVTPHTHDYEFKGFTWEGNDTDGYTKATASYKCSCGDEKTVEIEEDDLVIETLEPTCDAEGYRKYTAAVSKADSPDNEEHSETKTVTLPKKTEGCEITPEPEPKPDPVTPFPVPNTGIEAPGSDASLRYIAQLGICVFAASFFNKKH